MSTRPRSAVRRVATRAALLSVLVSALLGFLPASPASAHAFLVGSDPSDGQVLDSAPPRLSLQFSESVVLGATKLDLTDGDGRAWNVTSISLERSGTTSDTEQPVAVVAMLPSLPRNAYRLSWQTLSSDDLHRTRGLLVFGVGQRVVAAGTHETAPRSDESALRWALFLALALCLGGRLVARLCAQQAERGPDSTDAAEAAARSRRTALLTSVIAAGSALLLSFLLLADQAHAGGASLAQALSGRYGVRWSVREAGLLALFGAELWALRRGRSARARASTALFMLGASAAGIGFALTGHSGSSVSIQPTRVLADAAHLLTTACWSGAVICLAIALLPLAAGGPAGASFARAAARRFAVPAAACLSVAVVSGLYLVSDAVGSVDALLLTTYGRVLLVKSGIVVLALAVGALNHRRLRRAAGSRLAPRSILLEAGAAATVLALAALLGSGQPALEPQYVSTDGRAASTTVTGQVSDLQESVSVSPNRPGRNLVLLRIYDTRRPAPAPIRGVSVIIRTAAGAAIAATATSAGDQSWSAPVELTSSGRVDVQVLVQRPGRPLATASYPWRIAEPAASIRAATVSTAPIRSAVRWIAGVLAALLSALWLWRAFRRPDRGRTNQSVAASTTAAEATVGACSAP